MMQYLKKAKERTAEDHRKLRQTVSEIIENVCESGDRALHEYSRRFDASDRASFSVSRDEIEAAYAKMTEQELADLKKAKAHIEAFAKAQKDALSPIEDFCPEAGIHLGHRVIPVSSCCCYVPGGSYPLFSTALMLITPAKVAGVSRVCEQRRSFTEPKIFTTKPWLPWILPARMKSIP